MFFTLEIIFILFYFKNCSQEGSQGCLLLLLLLGVQARSALKPYCNCKDFFNNYFSPVKLIMQPKP